MANEPTSNTAAPEQAAGPSPESFLKPGESLGAPVQAAPPDSSLLKEGETLGEPQTYMGARNPSTMEKVGQWAEDTTVPGTGTSVAQAGRNAKDFVKIAGSEALSLYTGPEGLAGKILAPVAGKAAQMLSASSEDAQLAEWVEKMGIPKGETAGIIQKSLQAADGVAGKMFKDLTGFAEAYPHLAKVAKVAGISSGGALSLYGMWEAAKNIGSAIVK